MANPEILDQLDPARHFGQFYLLRGLTYTGEGDQPFDISGNVQLGTEPTALAGDITHAVALSPVADVEASLVESPKPRSGMSMLSPRGWNMSLLPGLIRVESVPVVIGSPDLFKTMFVTPEPVLGARVRNVIQRMREQIRRGYGDWITITRQD